MGVKVNATVNLKLMTALTGNKDCCIMTTFCRQIHQFTSLNLFQLHQNNGSTNRFADFLLKWNTV